MVNNNEEQWGKLPWYFSHFNFTNQLPEEDREILSLLDIKYWTNLFCKVIRLNTLKALDYLE